MASSILAAKLLGVFALTFVLEDLAVLTAAGLVAGGMLPYPAALATCFLGLWLGDVGIYALARWSGELAKRWPPWRARRPPANLARSHRWFERHGILTIVAARFIPGARLPTYVAAGFLQIPTLRFALLTGVAGIAWVLLVFATVLFFGSMAAEHLDMTRMRYGPALLAVAIALALLALARKNVVRGWQLLREWEFWPPWAFYLPVVIIYAGLARRYRSLTLPSVANPGFHTGGLIGESKAETLQEIERAAPGHAARSVLIPRGKTADRLALVHAQLASGPFALPVVLKPDVAQRGSGFRIARDPAQAADYFSAVTEPVILQEYVPGPYEAGIFYYRFPEEARGKIFAITEKEFPKLVGDGRKTVQELILEDPRACRLAKVYLARHHARRAQILPVGEVFPLVQAGNHAQGCIFREGSHLWSKALEDAIDGVAKQLDGFFIGRFDVRYADVAAFRAGQDFRIIELNGAASEATNAYDVRKRLTEVYGILRHQWELVFAIGAQNRARGCVPTPPATLWREWQTYRRHAHQHPVSD